MTKRTIDIVLSILLLIVTSPIVLIIILYLAICKHDILTKQYMCGRNHEFFYLYTFNIKQTDAICSWKSMLHHIPTLWNILKGNMSFVGPKPMTSEKAKTAAAMFHDYEILISSTPGLLSEAENYLPSPNTAEQFLQHCEHNAKYIRNRTILTDIEIIMDSMIRIFVKN